MPAVPFNPFVTYTDSNGNPLAGGKIQTFIAGTNTPLATYVDAAGVTPATNPIILDSAGRSPYGAIWGSGTYKFVLRDAADVLIQTNDNVSAVFGTGDMNKTTYDPANISQQMVGTTAVQTLSNKTFVAPVLGAATATSINFGGSTLSNYVASGSWTPTATGLTVVGTPTYTGTFTRIGNLIFCTLSVVATTSTASTSATTYFEGLPVAPALNSATVGAANVATGAAFNGVGAVFPVTNRVFTPTWPATQNVVVSFWYFV